MSNSFGIQKIQIGFLRAQYASIAFEQKLLGIESYFCYGLLAHYTNLEGLIGIVGSGGFWLSDIRFLNDANEFNHGRELALEVIEALIDRPRHKNFRDILKETAVLLERPIHEPYYVASFSRDIDSLEQWRAYASGVDGVSLVFEVSPPGTQGFSHFVREPRMHSALAIYDDIKKKRVVLNAISRFAFEYKKEVLAGDRIVTNEPGLWATHLVGALSNTFVTFKHHAFRTENEVRMVAHSTQIKRMAGGEIKHRIRGGRVVPYVNSSMFYNDELSTGNESPHLPLREVIVGPIAAQEVTIESVKVFLANRGYDVPVRPSRVPYRG